MGSFWDRFGIVLQRAGPLSSSGSLKDRFGFALGSFGDHFGIILGSFWRGSGGGGEKLIF